MSARAVPNPQIGTVACPVIGCSESCAVRRFARRAASDAARRQAGKLYFDCAVHGRFGFDGKAGMQDYILENGEIWGSDQPGSADERPPTVPAAAPASLPEPAKPAPAATPKAAPTSAAPAPPNAPAPKKKFDLWA